MTAECPLFSTYRRVSLLGCTTRSFGDTSFGDRRTQFRGEFRGQTGEFRGQEAVKESRFIEAELLCGFAVTAAFLRQRERACEVLASQIGL